MSVKSEILRIIAAKADLKRAINSKGGSIVNEKIDRYAAAVDLLNPEECGNRVRFIDYDGTILSTAYIADGGSAAPPELPEHEGLYFHSWNRDYENITGHRDIGACYATDACSIFKVRMTVNTGYTVSFKFYLNSGTVNVDWGDGTTNSYTGTGTKTASYTYADYGDYTVKFSGGSWYPASYFGGSGENTYLIEAWIHGPGKLENNAFYYCKGLRKIVLSNTVQTIGNNAFYECTALSSIVIPDSVTTLGTYCFYRCRALSRAVLSDSLAVIPESCFSYCDSLDTVTIADGVTAIGNQSFYYCYGLREVDIPSSVTTIGYSAFCYCYALHRVKLPSGLISLGNSAFANCYALEEATLSGTLTTVGYNIFSECYALRKLTLAPGLKTVPESLCYGCHALEEIVFPSSVATIKDNAFSECYRLLEVNIPTSVTTIGDGVFEGCRALRDVYMNATKPRFHHIKNKFTTRRRKSWTK